MFCLLSAEQSRDGLPTPSANTVLDRDGEHQTPNAERSQLRNRHPGIKFRFP